MPKINGFQAANAVRAINSDRKIKVPLVYITAHASKENINECYDNGGDSVITKPFERDDIFRVLYEFHPENTTASGTNDIQDNSETISIDLTKLLVSINKKHEVLERIVSHFRKNTPKDFEEIKSLYSATNYPDLKTKIHKLKSELGHFSANNAKDLCKNIENMIAKNDLSNLKPSINNLELEIIKIIAYFESNSIDSLITKFS